MAYQDDLLNAAQRRRARTGNSYFPAANTYRGININAGPSANAGVGMQGQTFVPGEGWQNPNVDTGVSSNAYVGSGRATPATMRNYINKYGTVSGNNVSFTTPSGGTIGFRPRGGTANYLNTNPFGQGVAGGGASPPAATPATPINYGSQVGFSMLGNVPSAPGVPSIVARPFEAPQAPFTTSETIGRTLGLANPLRAIAPIGNVLGAIGSGVYGFGRDVYGGFTGNRAAQPPPSEMGAGAIPVTNPITPNPWGNAFWNRGLPTRFSDAQPNDYFAR